MCLVLPLISFFFLNCVVIVVIGGVIGEESGPGLRDNFYLLTFLR